MMRLTAIAVATICGLIGCELGARAQDNFQKLSGSQIRTKFTGMELTDQSHWGEVYDPGGRWASDEMGNKHVGTWRIQKDQLCTDLGKDFGNNCYEVWMSGQNVQLRALGSDSRIEGVLAKPNSRR